MIDADHIHEKFPELEWSKPRLWRYETGQVPIHPNDVDVMCRVYGATADLTETLKTLARETKAKGWWHAYSEIPEWFQLFLGMEAAAHRIRQYEAEVVPGLLQSLPYARGILGQSVTTPAEEQIEQQSRVRMQRQHILTRSASAPPVLGDRLGAAGGLGAALMIVALVLEAIGWGER